MKITATTLSLPPYLSTTWDQVASIQTEHTSSGTLLMITLRDGSKKEIPGLDPQSIDQIFEAHAEFLNPLSPLGELPPFTLSLQKEGDSFPSLTEPFEHNAANSKLPNLPRPVLLKIAEIAKAFGLEDTAILPNVEENCNCIYCQLIRVMRENEPAEEHVSEEDLRFQDWKIEPIGDQLYSVVHPLDLNEQYQVFLGTPVGCTCGHSGCEHIQAVLKT